jgi:lysophospholipid acyltransferase (LPLAT)-like uncharacterized protein
MKIENRITRRILRKFIVFGMKLFFSIRKTLRYQNRFRFETPCVIAFFHGRLLPMLDELRGTHSVVITSGNHVGASIAAVLISWGFEIVYKSRRGERSSLERLSEAIEEGKAVIITPDGSRGPRYVMKAGAIVLAKKTGVPLYLVSPSYRGFRLKFSWDHFLYPYPFAKVTFRYRKMEIAPDLNRMETEQKIKEAEKILQDLSNPLPHVSTAYHPPGESLRPN